MKTKPVPLVLAIALAVPASMSFAATQSIETCIAAIQKQKPGELVKLEKLNMSGKPLYEFEIKDSKGNEWEFICDAETGKITETESEAESADSEPFKKTMKISEKEAAAIALKAHPGKIVEVEYEVESNGDASYEFDIVNDKGVETKVEVNAANGKIIETSTEEWEIGEEPDEKR
jgi:uncharacterized membrane protein YkoI